MRANDLSIAVISNSVGKTPDDICYSFVFDEIYRLSKIGLNINVMRPNIEGDSLSYGMHFYGLNNRIDAHSLKVLLKNIRIYPQPSLLRTPH